MVGSPPVSLRGFRLWPPSLAPKPLRLCPTVRPGRAGCRNKSAMDLLDSWEIDGDEQEQRETMAVLRETAWRRSEPFLPGWSSDEPPHLARLWPARPGYQPTRVKQGQRLQGVAKGDAGRTPANVLVLEIADL